MRVLAGLIPSVDGGDEVMAIGRPEVVAAAIKGWERLLRNPNRSYPSTAPFDHDWVPAPVKELGELKWTVHDGAALEFKPEVWEAVENALQALGYEVVRDDAKMRQGSGW